MAHLKKYSKENLESLVKEVTNLSDLVRKINNINSKTKLHGGIIDYVKKLLIKYEIDFSHFNGKQWTKGIELTGRQLSKEDLFKYYINDNSNISGYNLKKYIFRYNLLTNECSICKIGPIWQNQLLMLQLDHINGINTDNRLENLRFLCPNCHSQTDTYAGKNKIRKTKPKDSG